MSHERNLQTTREEADLGPVDLGHPRGTLAIVAIFGLLFTLGWLAMYLFRFLELGAPRG